MAEAPRITHSGNGSQKAAAGIAETLAAGVSTGLRDQRQPLAIDRLQIRLPVGASQADIARAVARAVAQKQRPR